jgi:hypothetical protein
MERIIEFFPAYDKRDPDPAKNYGIHGVNLRFLLKGDKGAIQFVVHTNWMLPYVQEEHDAKTVHKILEGDSLYLREPFFLHKPMPANLGYHSPVPVREWQEKPSFETCEVLCGPCYYDGSASNAEPVFNRLLAEGDAGVWAVLEDYYKELFGE